jgi:hypothetical protein
MMMMGGILHIIPSATSEEEDLPSSSIQNVCVIEGLLGLKARLFNLESESQVRRQDRTGGRRTDMTLLLCCMPLV